MTAEITKIDDKIATLEKAIASEATPEAQRVVMKEKLDNLEEQKANLIQAEQNGVSNKGIVLEKVFKAWHPQAAFAFTADGGYANPVSDELNADGTAILVKIAGESPMLDDADAKRLNAQIAKLNGKKEDVEVSGKNFTVTYTDVTASIKENTVTGSFVLKLSGSIKF